MWCVGVLVVQWRLCSAPFRNNELRTFIRLLTHLYSAPAPVSPSGVRQFFNEQENLWKSDASPESVKRKPGASTRSCNRLFAARPPRPRLTVPSTCLAKPCSNYSGSLREPAHPYIEGFGSRLTRHFTRTRKNRRNHDCLLSPIVVLERCCLVGRRAAVELALRADTFSARCDDRLCSAAGR